MRTVTELGGRVDTPAAAVLSFISENCKQIDRERLGEEEGGGGVEWYTFEKILNSYKCHFSYKIHTNHIQISLQFHTGYIQNTNLIHT